MNELTTIRKILNNEININTNKLYIEITNKCNLFCSHCYNESNTTTINELSLDIIEKLFDYAKQNKIDVVALSGGEALLHSKISDILERAQKKNIRILLLTNGNISNKKILELLLKYTPEIQVSLDGSNEEINDLIRGNGSFKKTVNFIRFLKNINYPNKISINSILTENRINDILPMKLLANNLNVSFLSFGIICKVGRAEKNNINLSLSNAEKLIDQSKFFEDEKCKSLAISHNCALTNIYDNTLSMQTRITCTGDVYPCQMFHENQYILGNLYKEDLQHILSNNKAKMFCTLLFLRKRKIPDCISCPFETVCGKGCMAKAIVENGNPMTSDNLCRYYIKDFIKELKENDNK